MSGSEDFRHADKVSITAVEAKAPSNALDEVIDFCSQTVQYPEARIRQTGTVLQGIVAGGIKDIPNELMNHPLETCGKVAVAAGIGIGAGALIGLEIPIVTGITIGAGVTMLGIGMLDSIKRMSSSKELQGALHNVWKSDDFYTQMQANDRAEKVLGPEAFNWGVTLPVGLVSGNFAAKMVSAKLLSGKPAVIPVDTPEIVPTEQTSPVETTGPITFEVNAEVMLPDTVPAEWRVVLSRLTSATEITIDGNRAQATFPDGSTVTMTDHGHSLSSKFETNKTPAELLEEAEAAFKMAWENLLFSKSRTSDFQSMTKAERLEWMRKHDEIGPLDSSFESNKTPEQIEKQADSSTKDQATGPAAKYWEAPGWKNPDYIDFPDMTMRAYRATVGDKQAMESPRYKAMVAEQRYKFHQLYRAKDEPVEIEPFKTDPTLLDALERALDNGDPGIDVPKPTE